jgi:hypothetical protein
LVKKLLFLILLILCLFQVYAITGKISNFDGQNNPIIINLIGNKNITYMVSIPDYVYINNFTFNIYPFIPICKQEFATVIPNCISSSVGAYANDDGFWVNPTYAWDGDYTTFAQVSAGYAYLYMNYSIPTGNITNVIWQVKNDTNLNNLSLPSSCYIGKSILQLRVASITGSNETDYDCSISQDTYTSAGIVLGKKIYEENIQWTFGSTDLNGFSNFNNTVSSNMSIYLNNIKIYNLTLTNNNISISLNATVVNNYLNYNGNNHINIVNLTILNFANISIMMNVTNISYSYGIDTCSQFIYPILNITYYNQENLQKISATNNYNLYFDIGTIIPVSGTTTNAYTTSFCSAINNSQRNLDVNMYGSMSLTKDEYGSKVYSIDKYIPDSLEVSPLTNQMYMIMLNESSTIIFTWLTNSYTPIDGIMQIYECFGNGTRNLVDATPITDGEATANIVLINSFYSYEIIYDGKKYVDNSSYSKCHTEPDTSRQFLVDIGAGTYSPTLGLYLVDCNITKSNNYSISMRWGDNKYDTTTLTGCLYGDRVTVAGTANVYTNCINNTNHMEVTVPQSGFEYHIYGKLFQGGYSINCKDTVSIDTNTNSAQVLGLSGVFAIIILVVGMILLFSNEEPMYYPIMGIVAIILSFVIGIVAFNWETVSALLIFVIIIIVIGRYHRKE